jgi:hypothetical protein
MVLRIVAEFFLMFSLYRLGYCVTNISKPMMIVFKILFWVYWVSMMYREFTQ